LAFGSGGRGGGKRVSARMPENSLDVVSKKRREADLTEYEGLHHVEKVIDIVDVTIT